MINPPNPYIAQCLERRRNEMAIKKPETPIKKKDKSTLLLNTGIITGTTLIGTGLVSKIEINKLKNIVENYDCKNHKDFDNFFMEKFKQIAKNSQNGELIHGYGVENLPYYFEEIESDRNMIKRLERLEKDEGLDLEAQIYKNKLQSNVIAHDIKVAKIESEFFDKFVKNTLTKNAARKIFMGAVAGLAIGLSIIGIRHLINKNNEKLPES